MYLAIIKHYSGKHQRPNSITIKLVRIQDYRKPLGISSQNIYEIHSLLPINGKRKKNKGKCTKMLLSSWFPSNCIFQRRDG